MVQSEDLQSGLFVLGDSFIQTATDDPVADSGEIIHVSNNVAQVMAQPFWQLSTASCPMKCLERSNPFGCDLWVPQAAGHGTWVDGDAIVK